MRNYYFLVITALFIAGCASTNENGTQSDLGDLGELDIKIDTETPIVGARDKAMDSYWDFMAGTKEKSHKIEALRRLADLEMERSDERFQKQMQVYSQTWY